MEIALKVALVPLAFIFMEFFAWWMHKYVMHGFLWVLHEDHHRRHSGKLEKNDLFTLFFSLIGASLLMLGISGGFNILFYLGVGVTLYGIGYFLFHDILYHHRIQHRYHPANRYLKSIVRAHALHHSVSGKEGGRSFGFLFFIPWKEVGESLAKGALE